MNMVNKDSSSLYDCAIIGYGPTGATLANLLGLCGLKVIVLEREAQFISCPVRFILMMKRCGCSKPLELPKNFQKNQGEPGDAIC